MYCMYRVHTPRLALLAAKNTGNTYNITEICTRYTKAYIQYAPNTYNTYTYALIYVYVLYVSELSNTYCMYQIVCACM